MQRREGFGAGVAGTLTRDASSSLQVIRPVQETIACFPSTRYTGSKRKLLRWIYSHIRAIPFGTALDAFGGSGSVSLLLKAMRKRVTYHDGLRFNEDVGRTVLADRPALSRVEIEAMLRAVKPRVGVISSIFPESFSKAKKMLGLTASRPRSASPRGRSTNVRFSTISSTRRALRNARSTCSIAPISICVLIRRSSEASATRPLGNETSHITLFKPMTNCFASTWSAEGQVRSCLQAMRRTLRRATTWSTSTHRMLPTMSVTTATTMGGVIISWKGWHSMSNGAN